jgi:hypothetical protein
VLLTDGVHGTMTELSREHSPAEGPRICRHLGSASRMREEWIRIRASVSLGRRAAMRWPLDRKTYRGDGCTTRTTTVPGTISVPFSLLVGFPDSPLSIQSNTCTTTTPRATRQPSCTALSVFNKVGFQFIPRRDLLGEAPIRCSRIGERAE